MPKVFVHCNPETTAVWGPLIPELAERGIDDCVLLSPPGFGAPAPAGFGGTRLDHRDWLIGELERLGEPVDLVGHDWGAGHTYAVVAACPDLPRSWAADCAGLGTRLRVAPGSRGRADARRGRGVDRGAHLP